MFDKVKVTNNLFGLVGFQNPANPDYAVVDAANQESRSGRFATENPYCKIEYLRDTQDYIDADDASFNIHLQNIQNKSISDVVDRVLIEPDYIDRQMLFQYSNNKKEVDTLPAQSFAGYRIRKSLDKNVAFKISRILLEFEGAGDIEILLFNTAKKEPIYSKVVTISSTLQEEALNWVINDSDIAFQGEWFIGYLTDGLTVQPIKRNYQSSNIKSCITNLAFDNIYVTGVTTNELFDLDNIDGASECWGLNPDVVVYNDYTNLIIQHENIFAPAIQLQMAINSIENYIASSRSNRNQRLSTDQINFIVAQIEGVEDRIVGYKPTLHGLIKQLNKQLERLIKGMFSTGFELNTLS